MDDDIVSHLYIFVKSIHIYLLHVVHFENIGIEIIISELDIFDSSQLFMMKCFWFILSSLIKNHVVRICLNNNIIHLYEL